MVTQTPLEGWGVATAAGETVALDLAVSDALRAEGWAREVVRLVQDARKSDGLQVSDRIELRWATPDEDLAAALAAHGELIAGRCWRCPSGPVRDRATRPVPGTSTPTTIWGCGSGSRSAAEPDAAQAGGRGARGAEARGGPTVSRS